MTMTMTSAASATMTTIVDNYIGGKVVPPSSNEYLDIINPATSGVIGKVALPNTADVDAAVDADAAARCHRILECHDEQSSGGHHARIPLASALERQ